MLQRVNVGCVWMEVWTSVFRCVCGRVCSGGGVQVGVWDRGRACVGGIGMAGVVAKDGLIEVGLGEDGLGEDGLVEGGMLGCGSWECA